MSSPLFEDEELSLSTSETEQVEPQIFEEEDVVSISSACGPTSLSTSRNNISSKYSNKGYIFK